ncbi:MAG: cobyrinate a,c-diamide synthase [Cyanobium sp.]
MACVIAAPCSGSGKTLLSLCLAAVARERGIGLQPFKVGPDYLDPQLLSAVAGRSCRNLDTLLCGHAWVQRCVQWHGARAERVLVEGVMGLFDGRGAGSEASTAEVAALLQLPVVLVVEASRQAGSLGALVRGFRDHGPPAVQLAGVVLNRVGSERHRALLAEALAAIEVPLLGVLPHDPSLALPSRHLGLLPPAELNDLALRRGQWAALAETHLDLDRIWPLLAPPAPVAADVPDPIRWVLGQARSDATAPHHPDTTDASAGNPQAPPPSSGEQTPEATGAERLPVAIASDLAFHFRYPEVHELLEVLGLDPRPWSPLSDAPLPAGCRAVILPGGYPELHAEQLAASRRSLADLRSAARRDVPIVAECGGLLLLGERLHDADDRPHAMAGLLPFSARRGALTLGYRQATALSDGLLIRRGERFAGHEFHRWQLEPAEPDGLTASGSLAGGTGLWQLEGWGWPRRAEGWTNAALHASWLHLHWAGCPEIPLRLAAAAACAAPPPMNGASSSPRSTAPTPAASAGG